VAVSPESGWQSRAASAVILPDLLTVNPSPARVALPLFFTLAFFFALASTGRVRVTDEVLPVFQAESLVLRGSTAVPQAVEARLFYGKRDRRGQPQAPYAPGHAVAAVPWYLAGRHILARLPGVPARAADLVVDFTLTMSSAVFAALAATLVFLAFLRLGLKPREAVAAAFVVALATPLFAYAAWFFSEPLAAALVAGAACALAGGAETTTDRQALIAGALLGAAVWVRPSHVLAALVFVIAVLVRERTDRVRPAILLGAVVALAGAAYLARNAYLFGNAFDFGYPEVAEQGKRLNTFETPLYVGLFGFLFSPGKSVFLFAPPALLAVWGLGRLWRRDRGLATLAGLMPAAYILFFAGYTQWEGGYCFGPRYLVPATVLLCLALGPVVAEARENPALRRALWAVFLAGVLVQAIGLATSFLEDQAGGAYYDAEWNYRLDYTPLASQAQLLFGYLASPEPAPIGRGFDRWFVFLAKGGVSRATLAGISAVLFAGFVVSAWRLRVAARGD
jgi:hypothetical protein